MTSWKRNNVLHVFPALGAKAAPAGLNISESRASSKFPATGISTVNPLELNQFSRVFGSSTGTLP
jgi:hypothetical protein